MRIAISGRAFYVNFLVQFVFLGDLRETMAQPVDEYLPIMYDRHPREDWKSFYQNRDLKAFSVQPLYIYPTHYTGEEGYLSDTEDSLVMAAPSCGKQNCEPSNATKDEL